jgi:hypothetical protein
MTFNMSDASRSLGEHKAPESKKSVLQHCGNPYMSFRTGPWVKVRAAEEYRPYPGPLLLPVCAAVSALVSAHPPGAALPWRALARLPLAPSTTVTSPCTAVYGTKDLAAEDQTHVQGSWRAQRIFG